MNNEERLYKEAKVITALSFMKNKRPRQNKKEKTK